MTDETAPGVLDEVHRFARGRFPEFAGAVYLEGQILVGFTVDEDSYLDELRGRFPDVDLETVEARWTYDELQSTLAAVSSDITALWQDGVRISSVGLDEHANRIVVSMPTCRPDWIAAVRRRHPSEALAFVEGGPIVLAAKVELQADTLRQSPQW